MLRYSPASSSASHESIVHLCSIGGNVWVEIVDLVEWPLGIANICFLITFSLALTSPTNLQEKRFYISFSPNHFHLGLLPSSWIRPWNTLPSKTRPAKVSLRLGSTFVRTHTLLCIHISHFHHLIFFSPCPFFWHYSKGKKSFPSSIHCIVEGIVFRGLGTTRICTTINDS